MEIDDSFLGVNCQGASDHIKKLKIYTLSGVWGQISLFGHGALNMQTLPFSYFW